MEQQDQAQLAIHDNTNISTWGDAQTLKSIVERLRAMIPGSSRISDEQILAGAQRALLEGKNPFNGELYITSSGVMDGYRGIQKEIERIDRLVTRYRQMTPDERRFHGLGDMDIGVICELYDVDLKRKADAAGVPYEPTLGVGIVWEVDRYQTTHFDEHTRRKVKLPREKWTPVDPPAGRSWGWVAQKRAYKDALRMSGMRYVSGDDLDDLRDQANAVGIIGVGSMHSARELARAISVQTAQEERMERLQAESQLSREVFGDNAYQEIAEAKMHDDIDALWGAEGPADHATKAERFWNIPDAWVDRLVQRVGDDTGGYYRHIRHIENTLRQAGIHQVTKINVTEALQTLINHARERAGRDEESGELEQLSMLDDQPAEAS